MVAQTRIEVKEILGAVVVKKTINTNAEHLSLVGSSSNNEIYRKEEKGVVCSIFRT
jgi:hypothetical protein